MGAYDPTKQPIVFNEQLFCSEMCARAEELQGELPSGAAQEYCVGVGYPSRKEILNG